MNSNILLLSIATGGLTFAAVLCARDEFHRGVEWLEEILTDRLRQLRIKLPHLQRYIYLWMLFCFFTLIAIWLAADALPFAILFSTILLLAPWYYIRRAAWLRHEKIEAQLADAMSMFSSAIRAGLSLAQSLELLAVECPKPISQEFQQMTGEYQMGRPLDRTLEEAKARLKSENFLIFSAALLAARESGGKLNETVERIAQSVLEMQRLERKVQSDTAQARKSASYMSMVPPAMLVVYAFVVPENLALLFFTFPGQLMLVVAVLLNLIAYFWALKILQPDL